MLGVEWGLAQVFYWGGGGEGSTSVNFFFGWGRGGWHFTQVLLPNIGPCKILKNVSGIQQSMLVVMRKHIYSNSLKSGLEHFSGILIKLSYLILKVQPSYYEFQ